MHTKSFVRIVTLPDGRSAFEDDAFELTEYTIAKGVPAMLIHGLSGSAAVTYLETQGFDSAPHPAPRRQWVLMVRGLIEVTVSDGTARRFGPGDLVFAADTDGLGHMTIAVGAPPFEGLFVAAI